jgi:arylsulfatase A-like enzyme
MSYLGTRMGLRRSLIARGAAIGAATWSAFGLVEATLGVVLAALFPSWTPREPSLLPLTLLVALTYPLIGVTIGAAAGAGAALFASRPQDDARATAPIEAVVTLSILLAVSLTLAFGDFGRRMAWLCLAIDIGLAIAVIVRAVRPGHRVAALGGIWLVSLAAAGVPHLVSSAVARGAGREAVVVAAIWIAALTAIALAVVPRFAPRVAPRAGDAPSRASHVSRTARTAVGLACAWLLLLLATWTGDERGIARAARSSTSELRAGRPNIVLITMDTVRHDHLSTYGYDRDTSPRLTALAREGTRYTHAIAAGNMTLTTHGSMFTGRYPSSHGALPPATPLPNGVPTLAERLGAAGYQTAAIVGNRAFLHPSLGLARGFDYYDCRLPDLLAAPRPLRLPRDAMAAGVRRLVAGSEPRPFYRQAGEITREALRWLDASTDTTDQTTPGVPGNVKGSRPFFLFLNYMDAHTPYAPPAPYDTRFGPARPAIDWRGFAAMKREVMADARRMSDAERQPLIDAYDGSIAYLDAEIGRLFDGLRARGVFDDTLVVVTSDHGEAFDEHGVVEHGVSVYQHQVHVPLIVKWPRSSRDAGSLNGDPVSSVDLLPTILDVAEQATPPGVQGRSLRLREPGAEPAEGAGARTWVRLVFAEGFGADGHVERGAFESDGRKLIVDRTGRARLFDISADRREQDDLLARRPADAARLQHALARQFDGGPARPATTDSPSADTLERLRSLGYVK